MIRDQHNNAMMMFCFTYDAVFICTYLFCYDQGPDAIGISEGLDVFGMSRNTYYAV